MQPRRTAFVRWPAPGSGRVPSVESELYVAIARFEVADTRPPAIK
jgi:hypothetical protein